MAFLEPAPGFTLSEDEVRESVSGRLARFKIPKRYVIDPALPRTASGKIDKPALKARALEST